MSAHIYEANDLVRLDRRGPHAGLLDDLVFVIVRALPATAFASYHPPQYLMAHARNGHLCVESETHIAALLGRTECRDLPPNISIQSVSKMGAAAE